MSNTQARILSIAPSAIRVSIAEQSACGSCRSKSACGVGTVRNIEVDKQKLEELKVGDHVELILPTAVTLGLACLLYLPPTFGFLLGMGLSNYGYGSDTISLLGGILGLMAGFALTWAITRFNKNTRKIHILTVTRNDKNQSGRSSNLI